MSDNKMYNILNTLKGLEPTPEQTAKATAQSIYESVAAQGSVMEGVNSVEARLNEKYMGFKKTVAAVAKGGADNPEAVAASIGRKKYGKAAFQKAAAAAAGKKMGEAVEVATKAPAAAAQPGPIVLVHKAYRENIAKAKEVLERFHHSEGIGKQLKLYPPSGKYGPDYYEFHLDKKPHNSIDAVERTLKSEGVKAGVVDGREGMAEDRETLQTKKALSTKVVLTVLSMTLATKKRKPKLNMFLRRDKKVVLRKTSPQTPSQLLKATYLVVLQVKYQKVKKVQRLKAKATSTQLTKPPGGATPSIKESFILRRKATVTTMIA